LLQYKFFGPQKAALLKKILDANKMPSEMTHCFEEHCAFTITGLVCFLPSMPKTHGKKQGVRRQIRANRGKTGSLTKEFKDVASKASIARQKGKRLARKSAALLQAAHSMHKGIEDTHHRVDDAHHLIEEMGTQPSGKLSRPLICWRICGPISAWLSSSSSTWIPSMKVNWRRSFRTRPA
jgi:hypothetical protein